MRMDRSRPTRAEDLVNNLDEEDLARLFAAHGEQRFAHRIARSIVRARPIPSTTALADLVAAAVPAGARRRGNPAGRVFQALRVAVNGELDVLPVALDAALAQPRRRGTPGHPRLPLRGGPPDQGAIPGVVDGKLQLSAGASLCLRRTTRHAPRHPGRPPPGGGGGCAQPPRRSRPSAGGRAPRGRRRGAGELMAPARAARLAATVPVERPVAPAHAAAGTRLDGPRPRRARGAAPAAQGEVRLGGGGRSASPPRS